MLRDGDAVSFARRHAGFLAVASAGLGLRLVLAYLVFPNQGLSTDLGFFESWARTLLVALLVVWVVSVIRPSVSWAPLGAGGHRTLPNAGP